MPAPFTADDLPCRRGLVALGDSITFGEGQPMLGVRCQSWALWLAEALELPFTNLAANGAQARDLESQLDRMRGRYEVCCLYIGVNDARALDFDPSAFAAALASATSRAAEAADHLLMVTLPLDLGRPRAGVSVLAANRLIREIAGRQGATVVTLEDLKGWRLALPDAVHLTALGQVEVAERAISALRASGVGPAVGPPRPAVHPAATPYELAGPDLGIRSLARYAVTGLAVAVARDLRRRLREGTLG